MAQVRALDALLRAAPRGAALAGLANTGYVEVPSPRGPARSWIRLLPPPVPLLELSCAQRVSPPHPRAGAQVNNGLVAAPRGHPLLAGLLARALAAPPPGTPPPPTPSSPFVWKPDAHLSPAPYKPDAHHYPGP